jgi:uncharacterized protein (DUF1778 family)
MCYAIFATIEGQAHDAWRKRQWGADGRMDDVKFSARIEPEKKDCTVHVRVTADEHAAIETAAEVAGMTVSGFFRSLLLEGAGVRPILTTDDRLVMAALLEDMRMIGINLNQVARALNSGRGVHPSELDINLENVQRVQVAVMSELRALSRRAGYQRRGEQ